MIGFEKHFESETENNEFFGHIVRELTGDFVTKVECDQINQPRRKVRDEVIYFGPASDLVRGGEAEEVVKLSMQDRYNFDKRAMFVYNDDPKCRKSYGLDESKRYVTFMSSNDADGVTMTIGEDEINQKSLTFALTTSIVKETP